MEKRFTIGDRVKWRGVKGRVVKDWKYPSPDAASLEVEFEARALSTAAQPTFHRQYFLYDGRLHSWHLEPSLELEG